MAATKTAEEEREERAERTRAKRISVIHAEINKAKAPITVRDIAKATGYSEGIVISTIRLVNRTMNAISVHSKTGGADAMYTYKHGLGWEVAASWAERSKWHLTLHDHATTRCESLKAEADVAIALWPGGVPPTLAIHYGYAIDALDRAGDLIADLRGAAGAVAPPPKKAKRAVKQHG